MALAGTSGSFGSFLHHLSATVYRAACEDRPLSTRGGTRKGEVTPAQPTFPTRLSRAGRSGLCLLQVHLPRLLERGAATLEGPFSCSMDNLSPNAVPLVGAWVRLRSHQREHEL